MFKHFFGLAFALGLLAAGASAQSRAPKFEDYPVREVFKGRNAPVRLTGKDERQFRTQLREAAKEKPDFAGHYVVATWGCGAGCVMGAIIDAKTGGVTWFPATFCCWWQPGDPPQADNFEPVVYKLDSSLIAFAGARNEKETDVAMHFYKLVNGRLVHVVSIPKGKAKSN